MILILFIIGILIGVPLLMSIHGHKNMDIGNDSEIPTHD